MPMVLELDLCVPEISEHAASVAVCRAAALARGSAANGRPSGAARRGCAGSLVGWAVMVDDRAAHDAQDAIRARLEAEAEPTKAALRELARRGRSKRVRAGAKAKLRQLHGAEDVSGSPASPALTPEAIKRMRDVTQEL